MRKQNWMRKGVRVLALLKPGTITRTRYYNIDHQQYVYLFEVRLDGEEKSKKFHTSDVEELTNEKL